VVLYANGAPERIRTADPQIRSLVEPIEIIRVRYRKGRLSRLSLEFSMHRFKARYRTERCSNLGGISLPKPKLSPDEVFGTYTRRAILGGPFDFLFRENYWISPSAFIASCTLGRAATRST